MNVFHRTFPGWLLLTAAVAAGPSYAQSPGHPLLTIETLPWRETNWRTVPVRRLEDLPNYNATQTDTSLGRFGGLAARKVAGPGFFRVQKVDNRWWMVDPDGCLFLNRGVDSVNTGGSSSAREATRAQKFGTKEQWASQTLQLLRDNGFNGTACWSDDALLGRGPQRIPYTPRLGLMGAYKQERRKTATFSSPPPGKSGYPADAIPVFDPEFPAFCDRLAQPIAATKDDPYLIGYFSDNELPFLRNTLDGFLLLDPQDPGYHAALDFLQAQHGSGADPKAITDNDRQKFVALVGEKYFSIVSKAIKKYDPNHLFLGSRFHSHVMDQPLFMQKVGPYIDVVGINYYGQWTPNPERLARWTATSGKPFIITEFYAKGADTGMGNTSGAGWVVKTQRDRGLFYEQFTLGLLENRGCVGWHWFQYIDNDPEGKADPSNNNSNKGIVNTKYEPYQPLLEEMKRVNTRAYGLITYFDRNPSSVPLAPH